MGFLLSKARPDGPMVNPLEMAFLPSDPSSALARVAVFEATLITPNAPFDRFLRGDAGALSESWDGAQGRNRTTDTVIFSHVLYQLSYLGASRAFGRGGRL